MPIQDEAFAREAAEILSPPPSGEVFLEIPQNIIEKAAFSPPLTGPLPFEDFSITPLGPMCLGVGEWLGIVGFAHYCGKSGSWFFAFVTAPKDGPLGDKEMALARNGGDVQIILRKNGTTNPPLAPNFKKPLLDLREALIKATKLFFRKSRTTPPSSASPVSSASLSSSTPSSAPSASLSTFVSSTPSSSTPSAPSASPLPLPLPPLEERPPRPEVVVIRPHEGSLPQPSVSSTPPPDPRREHGVRGHWRIVGGSAVWVRPHQRCVGQGDAAKARIYRGFGE